MVPVSSTLTGLSPLARGNLRCASLSSLLLGPIPARAGEPQKSARGQNPARAYPRSRGGTPRIFAGKAAQVGLSPLARGNPSTANALASGWGPIPARAGEPGRACRPDTHGGAYPRSRGGTDLGGQACGGGEGLSPLARGNRIHDPEEAQQIGPIPARAGEPKRLPQLEPTTWAYPRSRGGTRHGRAALAHSSGLSPLARGNQAQRVADEAARGPIPARAGEP